MLLFDIEQLVFLFKNFENLMYSKIQPTPFYGLKEFRPDCIIFYDIGLFFSVL